MTRRVAFAVLRPVLLLGVLASGTAQAQEYAQEHGGSVSLSVPATGAYDFHDTAPASPAQRLRTAPLPDPGTLPKPDRSLHDPATGADTTAFGTAYTYPNPNTDTTSGPNAVGNAASRSAGLPVQGGGLVLFEWGFPPRPMPLVPGDDLTAAPPPVREMRFAVQADDAPVLDARSLWIVQRAVQAYDRAGLTEITVERPFDRPGCCRRYPDLVRAELIRSGIGPDPAHRLPDHRIRLVQAATPVARQGLRGPPRRDALAASAPTPLIRFRDVLGAGCNSPPAVFARGGFRSGHQPASARRFGGVSRSGVIPEPTVQSGWKRTPACRVFPATGRVCASGCAPGRVRWTGFDLA